MRANRLGLVLGVAGLSACAWVGAAAAPAHASQSWVCQYLDPISGRGLNCMGGGSGVDGYITGEQPLMTVYCTHVTATPPNVQGGGCHLV